MDFVSIYNCYNQGNSKKITRLGNHGIDFLVLQKLNEKTYQLPISVFTNTAMIQPPEMPRNVSIEEYTENAVHFLKSEIDFFRNTKLETGLDKIILMDDPEFDVVEQSLNGNYIPREDDYEIKL